MVASAWTLHSCRLTLYILRVVPNSLPTFSAVHVNAQIEFLCQVLLQISYILCQSLYSFFLLPKPVNHGSMDFVSFWIHSFGTLYLEIHWSHWMNPLAFITGSSGKIFVWRQKVKIIRSENLSHQSPCFIDEKAKTQRDRPRALETRRLLVFNKASQGYFTPALSGLALVRCCTTHHSKLNIPQWESDKDP